MIKAASRSDLARFCGLTLSAGALLRSTITHGTVRPLRLTCGTWYTMETTSALISIPANKGEKMVVVSSKRGDIVDRDTPRFQGARVALTDSWCL
jgi:hypothetical protein